MSDMPPPFFLTEGDRHSPLWLKLSDHLRSKLRDAHGKLEGDQSEQQTAMLRGHIKCLKALITLGDEPPIDG